MCSYFIPLLHSFFTKLAVVQNLVSFKNTAVCTNHWCKQLPGWMSLIMASFFSLVRASLERIKMNGICLGMFVDEGGDC